MSLFLRVQEMKETKHQGGPLYSVALSFLSLSLQRFISSFSFFSAILYFFYPSDREAGTARSGRFVFTFQKREFSNRLLY